MVESLSRYSAICNTSGGYYPINQRSGQWEGPRLCCLNVIWRDQRFDFMIDKSLVSSVFGECGGLKGNMLLAKVSCFESSLAAQEEIDLPSCDKKFQFIGHSCTEKPSTLVTSCIQQEISDGTKENAKYPNLKMNNLAKTKLHFLEERDETLLSKRILTLSRLNKVRSALEMFRSMDASGLWPNAHACNSLLSCLLRNGLVDDALEVFYMMNKTEMTTSHTYSLVLKAIANNQGYASALQVFEALDKDNTSKKKFDVVVYNTMISICGKAKNWFETEKMWKKLRQNGFIGTMVSYELLISIYVQCGQTELALEAYSEMVQNGLEPSEDVLKAILATCTKEQNWNLGISIFQKMLDQGIKPNLIAFNSMINCLGKAGKSDLAFKLYSVLKAVGHNPDGYTWNGLLCSLYRSKRYADAIHLFESVREERCSELNVHVYNTALLSCQRLGLWERSLQIIWQMERSGVKVSTISYNHAILACEVAREPKVALEIYRHMVHKKCVPDTFTYLSLIRSCIWGSLWDEIEEILECVAPNSSFYNALIHGLCLRAKITLAKKMYIKMCSIGLKADGKTRALMLQYLPKDDNVKDCSVTSSYASETGWEMDPSIIQIARSCAHVLLHHSIMTPWLQVVLHVQNEWPHVTRDIFALHQDSSKLANIQHISEPFRCKTWLWFISWFYVS